MHKKNCYSNTVVLKTVNLSYILYNDIYHFNIKHDTFMIVDNIGYVWFDWFYNFIPCKHYLSPMCKIVFIN